MKIVFVIPAPPGYSPGQRFRFEHYLPLLAEKNIQYTLRPFFSVAGWGIFFKPGHTLQKVSAIFLGLLKRFTLLFTLHRYDYIYLYREAAPLGPPVLEWMMAKLLRKKIIYDFDDAIWIPLSSAANPFAAKLKCTWKVASICRWSHIVTTGNSFLASYAGRYCADTRIIPTVVDTTIHNRNKNQDEEPVLIGWTGTFTNFLHLPLATGAIRRLQDAYGVGFLVIADKDPQLTGIRYEYLPWKRATEVDDLLKMNIGIMPLINTDVQLGKCAFKAIQYMSLGIPAVVSPVGANCEVVDNGVNGFWADSENEWYERLEQLIRDKQLRVDMGERSRTKIRNAYSVAATRDLFIGLFTNKPGA